MPLELEALSHEVIGACIVVHKIKGPRFIESIYEKCLKIKLRKKGIKAEFQKEVEIFYEGELVRLKMKRLLPLFTVFIIALSSCSKNQYSATDVAIKSEGFTDQGIELRFNAPSESLYYCPGLDLDYDGHKVRYSYVRSNIDKSPSVDAKAEYRDGESVVIIPFPPGHDRVELIDSSGKSIGAWENTAERKKGEQDASSNH